MIGFVRKIVARRRDWHPRPFPRRRFGVRIELALHPSDPALHRWRALTWWSAFITALHAPRRK